MRRWLLLLVDLTIVALATVGALFLRDNMDLNPERLANLLPYLGISLVCTAVVGLAGRMNRVLWRYSTFADYLRIIALSTLIVVFSVALAFAFSRLEGVARAVPVIQWLLMTAGLISIRVQRRVWFKWWRDSGQAIPSQSAAVEHVVVVGIGVVSELYIQAVRQFASQSIDIVGVLAEDAMPGGGKFQGKDVLGTVEDLPGILPQLEVHGVTIDRIVVATSFESLSEAARDVLLDTEKSTTIVIDLFAERLRLDRSAKPPASKAQRESISADKADERIVRGHLYVANPYLARKRYADAAVALILGVVLSPVILLVAAIVALDVGFPLLFWQKRPGMHGRPFKLYKFRTMSAAHRRDGTRISDEARLSSVGRLLRRTRLDELPQIYNVLTGDMSFIGPRPLLPIDQPELAGARLSVRPGITGWAQVNGGRAISAAEKARLDLWYIENASVRLDMEIVWRTALILLRAENQNAGVAQRRPI